MPRAGAASTIITPELGTQIQGGGLADQPARSVRDELEANALFITDGQTPILLVSIDIGSLQSTHVEKARAAMAEASGLPERNIIVTCTHTHSAPSVHQTNYLKPIEEGFLKDL